MRIGVFTLLTAQRLQHLIARHVGQIEVEKDDVVVVELAEIDALFAQIGGINIEAFRLEHQLDALGRRSIVLDQQNPHAYPLYPAADMGCPNLEVRQSRSQVAKQAVSITLRLPPNG